MRTLELCCGAGGATIGLHLAGCETRGFDNWKPAVETQQMNGFNCRVSDLKKIEWPRWKVECIWGSPPCPPFSVASANQLGHEDPRDCIPEWLDAVELYLPRLAFMENVKGITTKNHIWYVEYIVRRLKNLGYKVSWRVLDCADYGVPQNRQRFFLIARRDGRKCVWPLPTHAKTPEKNQHHWATMEEALGLHQASAVSRGFTNGSPKDLRSIDRPSATLTSTARSWVLKHNMAQSNRPKNPATGKRITHKEDGTDYYLRYELDMPAPTLTHVSGFWQIEERQDWMLRPGKRSNRSVRSPAPTIHFGNDVNSWIFFNSRLPSKHPVKLSVGQATILQGFPPYYHFLGPKTTQLKLIANAVPPIMAYRLVKANA